MENSLGERTSTKSSCVDIVSMCERICGRVGKCCRWAGGCATRWWHRGVAHWFRSLALTPHGNLTPKARAQPSVIILDRTHMSLNGTIRNLPEASMVCFVTGVTRYSKIHSSTSIVCYNLSGTGSLIGLFRLINTKIIHNLHVWLWTGDL